MLARRCALARLRAQTGLHLTRTVCNRLSTVPEPSAISRERVPTRQRELLSPVETQDTTKMKAAAGAGALLGVAGVSLASYTHFLWLQPLLPDLAAATLVLAGGGLCSFAAQQQKKASIDGASSIAKPRKTVKGASEYAIQLTPLNDEDKFASALKAIAQGASSSDANDAGAPAQKRQLGTAAEKALTDAEQTADEAQKEAREAAEKEALEALKTELEAGIPAQSLRRKLSPRVFVIDFDTRPPASRSARGAPRAAPSMRALLDELREQVSLLIHVASEWDEVVLRVTSPGGAVSDYGLAAAQFARLKAAGIKTTACVDLVAASGGYMLACAADRIVAAPFSIIGSIGVIAGAPNVHRLLDRGGIEFVQRTAGEYKRTINIFTPNTEEGLKKFDEELRLIHDSFRDHVAMHRGDRIDNVGSVCTGETWLALHAEPLGLVDQLSTSDAYLRGRQRDADVYLIRPKPESRPSGLMQLLSSTADAAHAAAERLIGVLPPILGWEHLGKAARPDGATGIGAAADHDMLMRELRQPPLLRAGGAGGALAGDAAAVAEGK